jgi:hypothetical protein
MPLIAITLLFLRTHHVLQVGFLCPVLWLVSAFLPCYTKHNTKTDKSAATLSVVMIGAIIAIVVGKVGLKLGEDPAPEYKFTYSYGH